MGIVIEISNNQAVVQTARLSYCDHCAGNKGCGVGNLVFGLREKKTLIVVANHQGAKVGDKIVLGLREESFLKSSVVLYLLPLLSFFLAMIGYEILVAQQQGLFSSEIFLILAGLFGLIVGFFLSNQIFIKISKKICYQPVIIRIIELNKSLRNPDY
ncbi:SoxR reducing system RseC family protein [Candidatus Parabeggiatoa sp. HSG14]|uniref:SoxR reducing system RseC family protein n=1 Tax=Candidatus Parabeggiatoa sp. HSG14 TaxID=3055593 RepID=UPI0032E495D2